MNLHDYMNAVLSDSKDFIDENVGYFDDFDDVYDALFLDDSVTGNGSGSYTFNAYQAAENVAGVIFDDEFADELRGLGYDHIPVEDGPEALDVIARCVALGMVSGELEEYWRAAC